MSPVVFQGPQQSAAAVSVTRHCTCWFVPRSSRKAGGTRRSHQHQKHRTPCAVSDQDPQSSSNQPTSSDMPPNPWSFGFQCNERYLAWDTSAQIALIKIWLAEKMELTVPEVEKRLAELGNLLPDMVGKMDRARADVLYELLKDPTATADRLLALRQLLPHCNVSALVAGHPKLLLGMTIPEVTQKVGELRQRLQGVDVDALIMQEPMLLKADLPRLMSELARLAPGADPVRLIASDPQMVLDMDVAGMPSTLEMDGVGL